MKMKKLGALLLAGVMTMSTLLTGCGNGASGSSAGGNASQTESGSNGERKKITILMSCLLYTSPSPRDTR